MNNIAIQLLLPTENGRLHYYRDSEIEHSILYIRRNWVGRAAHVINIDGVVSIALDGDFKIQSIECVLPRKVWQIGNEVIPPEGTTPVDIRVLINKETFLSLPITVITNANYEFAQVLFGTPDPQQKWVALSNQCFAIVSGDHFQGYYVRLTT